MSFVSQPLCQVVDVPRRGVSRFIGHVFIACGVLSIPACQRFNVDRAADVVASIVDGKLAANGDGEVRLREGTEYLSTGGIAYVTREDNGSMSVLFIDWRGKGRNMRGHLFTDHTPPFRQGDSVEVCVPDSSHARVSNTEIIEASVETTLGPNWYVVSYTLD
jgi:hypothetical protein